MVFYARILGICISLSLDLKEGSPACFSIDCVVINGALSLLLFELYLQHQHTADVNLY